MKTWLKGGLIGTIVYFGIFFIDNIINRFIIENHFLTNIISFPGLWIYINFIEPNLRNYEDWIILLPSLIFFIIIGILLGFIIQKIKSNKQENIIQNGSIKKEK